MGLIACNCKIEEKKEMILWKNPSPSSAFSAQTITLTDDMTNYRYIRIEGQLTTSNTTYIEIYTTPSYLFRCIVNVGAGDGCSCPLSGSIYSSNSNTNTIYARLMNANSSTPNQLYFSNGYLSSKGTTSTAYIIPTKVIGII